HDLGVAFRDQFLVDHHVAQERIGQQAPVAVTFLEVEFKAHRLPVHKLSVSFGRLPPARLRTLRLMMELGRIQADVTHGLNAAADSDFDGDTIDDGYYVAK